MLGRCVSDELEECGRNDMSHLNKCISISGGGGVVVRKTRKNLRFLCRDSNPLSFECEAGVQYAFFHQRLN
jgi:hypothetical protein